MRGLLQCFPGDAATAFVLAHEIAHHDLGHVQIVTPQVARLHVLPGGITAALLLRLCLKPLRQPARETVADVYALHLCIAAGYEGAQCLELFDALERFALDHGDLDTVFGSDAALRARSTSPPATFGALWAMRPAKRGKRKGAAMLRSANAAPFWNAFYSATTNKAERRNSHPALPS